VNVINGHLEEPYIDTSNKLENTQRNWKRYVTAHSISPTFLAISLHLENFILTKET